MEFIIFIWCMEISLDFGVRPGYFVLGSITNDTHFGSFKTSFALNLLREMGIIVLT